MVHCRWIPVPRAVVAADVVAAVVALAPAVAASAAVAAVLPLLRTLAGVTADPNAKMRVVMAFPEKASDMLLSGTLVGGEALSSRAQLVDESVGKGHIVMFAFRPYWRWQTQGTFAMGFNAIVNWDHLDAGSSSEQVKAK